MYEDKTPEALKAEMLAALEGWDTREGSFADDMAGPLAVELFKLYSALNAVQPMVWVTGQSGRYLDMAAEDIGIPPRKEAVKARALLTLTGRAGATVQAGTLFRTAENLCFALETDTELSENGAQAWAEAQQAGTAYNVPSRAVIYQYQNDSRITDVYNEDAAQGGADQESDKSLYARIVAARQRPSTSGNEADYEKWALEAPGVGFAKATAVKFGPGTVGVLIADEARQPVDEATVGACAAHIEAVRPVGAQVRVISVSTVAIKVMANVQLENYVNIETVKSRFIDQLEEYFQSISMSADQVRYNRVGSLLMGINGVSDFSGLALNGDIENIPLGDGQIPELGEVVLLQT